MKLVKLIQEMVNIYSQQKVKKSISKKYLTGILAKFFQNDPGQAKNWASLF